MKISRIGPAVLVILILLLCNVAPVYALPPIPSSFYGTVTIDGNNAPLGMQITAWIDGVKYATGTVTLYNGNSVYSIDIPGDDPTTSSVEGGVSGSTITFYVGNQPAPQTMLWESGTNRQNDLAIVTSFTLTILSEHGTVVKDPDKPIYHYGDSVLLTATPDEGWSFISWSGDISSTSNPVSLFIDEDKTITANFSDRQPADLTNLLNNRPTFSWPAVAGASSYQLQTSLSKDFSTLIIDKSVVNPVYTPTSDLPANKAVYWRYRSKTGTTYSSWSPIWKINTANPPTIPSLVSPLSSSLLSSPIDPLLDWSSSSVPIGTTFAHYQLQVALNSDFSTMFFDQLITGGASNSKKVISGTLDANTRFYWRVRAYNTLGQYSSWSSVWSFRTRMTEPVLLAPIGGVITDSRRPVFDWEDVPGATSYSLQASLYSNFSTILLSNTAAASTYTPTTDLPANRTIYWRVKANGANPSLYSTVQYFKTANPPGVPTLLTPINSALLSTYQPTLDWTNSSVPTGTTFDYYQLQVATTSDFTTPVLDQQLTGAASASKYVFLTDLSPNTRFYWRVRAFNTLGQSSSWSSVWSFRTRLTQPVPLSPIGGVITDSRRPVFDWEDVPGATSYSLQASLYSNFSTILLSKTAAASTYTPTADLPANRTIYWRVKANGANPSLYSTMQYFKTANPPGVPTLLIPINSALLSTYQPTLDWTNSSVPTGTTFDRYQLQVSTKSDFTDLILEQDIPGLASASKYTFTADLSPNTRFYWRVRAYNTLGQYSSWSSVWSFRTRMTEPVLLAPIGGVITDSRRPVFDWEDVPSATSYSLQASLYSNFSTILLSKTAAASTYTPTADLPANRTIYWRVKANGANPSLYSAVENFKTP